MKLFKVLSVSLFLLLPGVILVGCTGPTPTPTATPAVTAAFIPAATPVPTASAAPVRTSTPAATPAPVSAPTGRLQWLGHSAFLFTSSQGTRILIDPPGAGVGYEMAPIEGADAVLVSHEHSDHNNVSLATGSPLILRGLTPTGWNTIDQRVKDIRVYSVSPVNPVYHDNQQGAQRGRNTIFTLEVDGVRLAHAGDLGHVLTPEIVMAMGTVDVALIPVGGVFTVDAAGATQVVGQLNPRLVIPMHYKTPRMRADWPGVGVEIFLEGKRVERPNSTAIKLSRSTLPAETVVVVLDYE